MRSSRIELLRKTDLPPTIAVEFILLDHLDTVARAKGYLVLVLRNKIMQCIYVFRHRVHGFRLFNNLGRVREVEVDCNLVRPRVVCR